MIMIFTCPMPTLMYHDIILHFAINCNSFDVLSHNKEYLAIVHLLLISSSVYTKIVLISCCKMYDKYS